MPCARRGILRIMLAGGKFSDLIFHSMFALVVGTGFLQTARAQFAQQGGKLVGTGIVGVAGQGESVALSADRNTAIVGGPNDNNDAGAAWVYARSGGVWSQQGSKLIGTGVAGIVYQGGSVALSGDGNTAIVGRVRRSGSSMRVRQDGEGAQAGAATSGTRRAGRGRISPRYRKESRTLNSPHPYPLTPSAG
jgi:hypothetical protein